MSETRNQEKPALIFWYESEISPNWNMSIPLKQWSVYPNSWGLDIRAWYYSLCYEIVHSKMLLFDSLVMKCVFDTWDEFRLVKWLEFTQTCTTNPSKRDRGICFLFSTSQFKPSKKSWWLCWFTILGRSMFQFLPYQDLGGEGSNIFWKKSLPKKPRVDDP